MKLNYADRKKIMKALEEDLTQYMFGDGDLEYGYVMHGINFKGLLNMTDAELFDEYGSYVDDEGNGEHYALYKKILLENSIEEELGRETRVCY